MSKPAPKFILKSCPWPGKVLEVRDTTSAFSVGLGLAADQHFALRDGRFFRIADEDETPHAVFPLATEKYPCGIPLRAVSIVDMHDDDYQRQVANLPARPQAIPRYHYQGAVGAGGHTRTDE